MNPGWYRMGVEIAGAGNDRSDTGANVVALDDRGVPHFDAGDIGYRIKFTGRKCAHNKPDIARPWPVFISGNGGTGK